MLGEPEPGPHRSADAEVDREVENVDSRDEVEIGDLLVTSGKGKWFPKGLPVARVTKVVKGGKNLSFSALVVVGDTAAKVVGFGTGERRHGYDQPIKQFRPVPGNI